MPQQAQPQQEETQLPAAQIHTLLAALGATEEADTVGLIVNRAWHILCNQPAQRRRRTQRRRLPPVFALALTRLAPARLSSRTFGRGPTKPGLPLTRNHSLHPPTHCPPGGSRREVFAVLPIFAPDRTHPRESSWQLRPHTHTQPALVLQTPSLTTPCLLTLLSASHNRRRWVD